MITKEDIVKILDEKSTMNEYYTCVTEYDFDKIADEILKQVKNNDLLHSVSGCFHDGYEEKEGCCDDGCEAVKWEKDECVFKNICPIGYNTVWKKPNNR